MRCTDFVDDSRVLHVGRFSVRARVDRRSWVYDSYSNTRQCVVLTVEFELAQCLKLMQNQPIF